LIQKIYLSWRWIFWINLPLSIVVIVVAAYAIPALRHQIKPVIDYAGIGLVAVGASGLILATSWGGVEFSWGSPTIVGLFVAAALALAALIWAEMRAREPILPTRLFRDPVFSTCSLLSFVVGFGMFGALAFLPTYMQYVDGVSATASGIRTLPMVLGLLITSTAAGQIIGHTGKYKVFPIAGTALIALSFLLMSSMHVGTSTLVQSVYFLVLGAGIGLCMQVLVIIVQNTLPLSDLGVATSGVSFFRAIGGSFGAAIFGSLFANFLKSKAVLGIGIPPSVLHKLPQAQSAPIITAYADSLTHVFICAVPVALVGFMLALTLREVPLRPDEPRQPSLVSG
jgi:MFS family permease